MNILKCALGLSIAFCELPVWAQSEESNNSEESAVNFSFEYTGDVATNAAGGVSRGTKYIGLGYLGVSFDTEKAKWWKGGEFSVSGANSHGDSFSEKFTGCALPTDNIEAGNHTILYELWYKQNFNDKFDFTLGLQDVNSDFSVCDEASLFVNSVFGLNSVLGCNFSVPVYPLPGLGLQLGLNFTDKWRLQLGVFDGSVYDFEEDNEYNTKWWSISNDDGYVSLLELHYSDENKGTYKIGADYHTAEKKWGVYAIGNHSFSENVAMFAQVAFSKKSENEIYSMVNAGLNFYHIFAKKHDDVLGFGCVSNFLNNDEKSETAIELTYKYQALKQFYIQPDIQYTLNPSIEKDLDNSLALILRFGIEL